MKITVFWDAAHCSLVEIDGRFRGAAHGILTRVLQKEQANLI
jgi:hypothetical protein